MLERISYYFPEVDKTHSYKEESSSSCGAWFDDSLDWQEAKMNEHIVCFTYLLPCGAF